MDNEIKVEFDVPATMRDGTILRANIFRPAFLGKYPVALTRTPYGKDFSTANPILDAVRLARAGYIVVIQDVRGRFRSEGEWFPLLYEDLDGYDSVEWAARLPGSNGRVGMFGASYFGFTQWAAAAQQPPSLKALMPTVTWADGRDGVIWRGGALELGLLAYMQLNAFAFDHIMKHHKDSPAEQLMAIVALVEELNRLRTEGYHTLPLHNFAPLQRLGLPFPMWDYHLANPNSRQLNAPISPYELYDQIQVPAYNVGGWYDIFLGGTLQNFNGVNSHSKLLVGPWSHINYTAIVGEVDFGFAAQAALINLQIDLTGLTHRWFDYWLKDIDNGILDEPPVKLFIMGQNVWRDEREWPLARTRYTPYYLHSGGRLSAEPPGDEPPDYYTYDPADPTPTHGGSLLMNPLFHPGAADQRPISSRPDVLTYTTEPLTQDTEVTGPLIVHLWAASDAPDTDFVARLIDVHPNGFAQNLADGIIRARYRNGETAEWLQPNQPTQFTINLWATANLFPAGHRIRLDITSSNFPRWDRNLNTADPLGSSAAMQPAHQTILHTPQYPSHIVLPLIPR